MLQYFAIQYRMTRYTQLKIKEFDCLEYFQTGLKESIQKAQLLERQLF